MKETGGACMIDTLNFIVRSSGRVDGSFYIDYMGFYKATDIAKTAKADIKKLTAIQEERKTKPL